MFGSYIFDSLDGQRPDGTFSRRQLGGVSILLLSVIAGSIGWNTGGFGPTYNRAAISGYADLLHTADSQLGIICAAKGIFDSVNVEIRAKDDVHKSGWITSSKMISPLQLAASVPTVHLDHSNICWNSIAKERDSGSLVGKHILTDRGTFVMRTARNFEIVFGDNMRQENCALSRSVSNLASAARALASATSSSDLRFISWSRLNPIRLNWTSPATPIKTSAVANVDPHRLQTESYDGWITPRITSATSPNATSPPKYQLQCSQESAETSKSPSLAFFTPFMRRHAGKGFRGFWFGIATGLLMFGLLFIAHYFGIAR